jgi:hypothetical protein
VVVVEEAAVVDVALLDRVTVTVTVVVACDLVLALFFVFVVCVLVAFAFVEVSLRVLGGATETVFELVVVWQPGTRTLVQRPVSGGPPGPLEVAEPVPVPVSVSVPVSVPPEVSVPPPVVVPPPVEDESEQAWVPMMWQSERPIPVVVFVSLGTSTAVSAGRAAVDAPEPPAARTLTGTAAITARGTHSRARVRIRANRSCGGTAPPSQGRPGPPAPPGVRAACICSHHRTRLCQGGPSLWQGGRMGRSARTRNVPRGRGF